MADLALLGVFAHPDDEQLMSGLFAKAAAEGMRTGLVCATKGELGEIADPSLATPENLGKVREAELRAAVAVIGVKHLWFLDYLDSGMMGTAGNDDPRCFYRVDMEEALAKLVKIVREFRPTVMVTFDETGGYGHPDHITVYRLATLAFGAAADPNRYPEAGEAWQTARLFYSAFPRSGMKRLREWFEKEGIAVAFNAPDAERFGLPDEAITNKVDVGEWGHLKEQSFRMHRTQMNPESPFAKMPPEFLAQMRNYEHYALGAGVPLPDGEEARGDLFAGLRD